MAHGARELGDFPEAMVRLYCAECHRFAQYGRDRLVERFGKDQGLRRPCSTS